MQSGAVACQPSQKPGFYASSVSAPSWWVTLWSNFFFNDSCTKRTLRLAEKITLDLCHILHEEYQLLPSGRRFRVSDCSRNKYKNSFVSYFIILASRGSKGGDQQLTQTFCDIVMDIHFIYWFLIYNLYMCVLFADVFVEWLCGECWNLWCKTNFRTTDNNVSPYLSPSP